MGSHRLDRDIAVVVVAMAMVSIVLVVTVGDVSGGLSWLLVLALGSLATFIQPMSPRALWAAWPLLAFLLFAASSLLWTPEFGRGLQTLMQFSVIPICFLLGWRLRESQVDVTRLLSIVALASLPVALVVFARAWLDGAFRFGWLVGNAARPMVIAAAALFVVGTINRSRTVTLIAGGFGLMLAVASGGRMGFAVLAVLIVLSPALGLTWRMRIALAGVGLVALSFVVQSDAFQERFFVGREPGTLSDIVLLRGNFNTAGRAENWPAILEECSETPALGHGIGSTAGITLQATNGATIHPHNEFIRTYCDLGWVGIALFWGFFGVVAWRGFIDWWRRDPSHLRNSAFQMCVALIAFSITDNVTIYTSAFMAPAALIIGMAERDRRSTLSDQLASDNSTRDFTMAR